MIFKWKPLKGPLQITLTNDVKYIASITKYFSDSLITAKDDIYTFKEDIKDIVTLDKEQDVSILLEASKDINDISLSEVK